MTKRKKRLEKGIESLKEQIRIHEQKRKEAIAQGKLELSNYYEKEIGSKIGAKEKKEKQLKRG